MQEQANFAIRYDTADTVQIRDIIESLEGIETIMSEMGALIPAIFNDVTVHRVTLTVREVAQQSPLQEIFVVALFMAYQEPLKKEVIEHLDTIGVHVPHDWQTIVTVLALALVFYGVGAVKDLVLGGAHDGPTKQMLDGLIEELAFASGKPPAAIREQLDKRYGDKTLWKRIAGASSKFFAPSKRQNSAAIEVNGRQIDHETVRDVPAQYLLEHEVEKHPARDFEDVTLELHAQDRDHAGKGWAAVAKGISDARLRLKLMEDVSPNEVWNRNSVMADITIVYDRVGTDLVPKAIHLHRVKGGIQ